MNDENRTQAARMFEIIQDFGAYQERNPGVGEIRDLSNLPHSKQEILDAIYFAIVLGEDEPMRQSLAAGAVMLANFQEGVGPKPLTALGMSNQELQASVDLMKDLSKDERLSLSSKVASKIAENPDRENYEHFKKLADIDLEDIYGKLNDAEQLRELMLQKINR